MRLIHLYTLLTLLVVALGYAQLASAQRSLECQIDWVEPSYDNDLLSCLQNSRRIGTLWRYYMWPGFAALILLFVVIGVSVIFCNGCCHCCCCCSCCCRSCQGEDQCCLAWVDVQRTDERKKARCSLWIWILIAILWACGVCVLIIYGVDLLTRSANQLLDNVENQPVNYLNTTKNTVAALVQSTNATLDLTAFDDLIGTFTDKISDIRNDYFKYFRIAQIVSICVGAVGVVAALLILVFSCCRCATCGFHFSGLLFFFAIIFALLSLVFTVVQYALFTVCGEVKLHARREPGVFGWLLVPWCEDSFDFTSLRSQLADTESEQAGKACTEMQLFANIYTTDADASKPFYATNPIAPGTCTTFAAVNQVISSLLMQEADTVTMCSGRDPCDVDTCVESCTGSLQLWAEQVVSAAAIAANASTALSLVKPLLDCTYIIDQIATAIETKGVQSQFKIAESNDQCTNLQTSSIMVACGFFIGTLMYVMAIYVLHRGSWIWKSTPYERRVEDCDNEHVHERAQSKSSAPYE